MTTKTIRIGGATGYWGESDLAVPQFLAEGNIDYIVFDYLAEITMSLLARARSTDPALGYATDFITAVVKPHLQTIAASGTRLISNAGGVNPEQCAEVIRGLIAEAGLSLKVAVVLGDDVLPDLDRLMSAGTREMFSGESLPPRDKIASANAYLGAFPIAAALEQGADIVITGRCVDSAVTLAACIHAFGWQAQDLDKLASGSLVGHLIECGPQVTGGNYTDWEDVADTLHEVGYPIAEVDADGSAVITKPTGTGGTVTEGTVGEQLLYEIGDPGEYLLPDVVCDFTGVSLETLGTDRVRVSGARGRGVPSHYKTSLTWADGWRGGTIFFYVGRQAGRKARIFADEAVQRSRRKFAAMGLGDFDDLSIELVGNESHWGESARYVRSREVGIKVACRHQDKRGVATLLKELSGAALGAPPGLCFFAGTRAKPSPVVRLFSTLIEKDAIPVTVVTDAARTDWPSEPALPAAQQAAPHDLPVAESEEPLVEVPLEQLAWARSGDKGDKGNVGIMAREPRYLPWIARSLTPGYVAMRYEHLMTTPEIDAYYLPGLPALNFVLHNVLGGGGIASLRNDPQAKCYAQVLLDAPIEVPESFLGDME